MSHVFLFGTLCWGDLLARVAGSTCPPHQVAELPGYQVTWAAGQNFPAIYPQPGAMARGILLRDCDASVLARMDHYESGFGYTLHPVTVTQGGEQVQAQVYLPPNGIGAGAPWVLQDWVDQHGALALEAAIEVMLTQGHMSPDTMARRYPMMLVRADARLKAQSDPSYPSESGLTRDDVQLHERRMPYVEFFAVQEHDLTLPKFQGGHTPQVTRACLLATDAAIVLPYDPVRDRVLLIEQFRAGPYFRGDPNVWMMEPVAGRVDTGEDAEHTARREAVEEANLTLGDVHLVHQGYASPGCSTEYFNIYVACSDIPDEAAVTSGLESEAEDIKGHIVPFDTFYERLMAGQYPVTPLALAGYWLALNRDRLRSQS
ncbi:MAG: gamma-glutamylcyclotransferase [Planktomarina sp.]